MEWVKALHVISIIAWMAALLYLPRLFVYHTEAEIGSKQSETFKIMERRLYRGIMTPAMIGAWVFGLWMAFAFNVWGEAWFWVKFASVFLLSGFHGMMGRYLKAFRDDRNDKSQKFFRAINEVPTVLMIIIVIMVIVRPF